MSLALTALLVVVAMASGSAAAAEPDFTRCDRLTKATDVSCQKANEVVERANNGCDGDDDSCHVLDFVCDIRNPGGEPAALRCIKDDKLIERRVIGSGDESYAYCQLGLFDDTGMWVPIDGSAAYEKVGQDAGSFSCETSYRLEPRAGSGLTGFAYMEIKDPFIGSNYYSCYATGSFRCFGPWHSDQLKGSRLLVSYYVCVPGRDVQTLGRHLPGYCGDP